MKLTLQSNPLSTIINLNHAEKILLKHKLIIEDLFNRLADTSFALTDRTLTDSYNHCDIDRARKACSLDFMDEDGVTGKRARRLDRDLKHIEFALTSDHEGDCTSVAHSCDKCYAEQLIGITTVPFNKVIGYHISEAFNNEAFGNCRTLDEAIAYLRSPITDAEASLSGVVQHDKPRFAALDVLTKHKQTLFVT
jgi:hypothetical protein